MNISKLKRLLKQHCISPKAYALEKPDVWFEGYYLEENTDCWIIYYIERGEKDQRNSFDQECDACECFLEELLSDPTTRIKTARKRGVEEK
ncbi:hypothetical protein KS4_26310 [Poriferisphaera corsica]|uniref:Uncharacterized protein n=1 Tax=Poriferisphaera corsica TaxID=2528020 RepID=A0A517YWE6_9BACT|nr:hypothetical protein [Poriferisphaera corsica]QDU34561.1 hypothetical protein KS4_26310 [Poriferisphaera corsica]